MNIEFKKIENIKDYIIKRLDNGILKPNRYQKSGQITARKGVVGEEIYTIMSNGLQETKNIVVADENGNPGWVVTNPVGGEQYIVSDSVLKSKYQKIDGTDDKFRPVGKPIVAAQVDENICFIAPWGELQQLVAGGYLVFDKAFNDVYGVQEKEFNDTYDMV